jgi:hypothetical protein
VRAVADQITAADDPRDPELVDPRQHGVERRQVGVDVGDDRDVVHAERDSSIDSRKFNRNLSM